ncbi:exodeoxyribonuclease V subunit alpha [Aestuariibacter halophilus]|uniref:RecBCD enzyme subunit RecD n=1 Tax=Fluctibacter halophilus TaxID=226011 RepID=A0ABS8G5I9_9ALTE|nr:exodeoxyribonuclease V subunit alpha [Aestuariibacter halophilus]MCC2615862.1 exodeoxyribonuclease V subunit alpha [Aestuariibacter halophilus]
MVNPWISQHLENGALRAIDAAFGEFIQQRESHNQVQMGAIAALLSARLGEQDSCVSIERLCHWLSEPSLSEPTTVRRLLTNAACVAVVEPLCTSPDDVAAPLVLEGDNLYLQRYWWYEWRLAIQLIDRARQTDPVDDGVGRLLEQVFPEPVQQQVDWQKMAVAVAARQRLSIITGGPGTGKTTTVTRLLAVLQGAARQQGIERVIRLVAPTGKAAARLGESVRSAIKHLPPTLQTSIPQQCETLHRLLGTQYLRSDFKYGRFRPLHLDVLVVDEASMIDLPMMCKLFEALPPHAKVIMLGDREQLASVETGSVLSDICAAALGQEQQIGYSKQQCEALTSLTGTTLPARSEPRSLIDDNLVVLQKSHRFSATSPIGQLSAAFRQGDTSACQALFAAHSDVLYWQHAPQPDEIVRRMMSHYQSYLGLIARGELSQAMRSWFKAQILCAQRRGPLGVDGINLRVEQQLVAEGLLTISGEHYLGRPVMVTENDPQLGVFNGDVAIIAPDPANPALMKAWFAQADGTLRGLLASRLPAHETVYAMTIHKSQGSEFDDVILCLPEERGSTARGLTRELLYTGLTRAKRTFSLFGSEAQLAVSLETRCTRSSALATRLAIPDTHSRP